MGVRSRLLLILLISTTFAQAAAPVRFDTAASVDSVPLSGGASFGTKFFFAPSNQVVYRVIPAGGTEADPAASWKYWSSSTGKAGILPAAGYASLEVSALSASGAVIGNSAVETPAHSEAALYWTLTGGPLKPTGFDAGYSGLDSLSADGHAAGFSNSGTFEIVAWNAASPGSGTTDIPIPVGYASPQVAGLSGQGKVLLFISDRNAVGRAAVWDGTATNLVGPMPTETFYPSNCAINSAGDVAMLVFTAGGAAKLHYIPASDPAHWLTFTFDGPVDSNVYNLRISDAGVASFDTSINGLNTVAIASFVTKQQFTFTGYRSYLNNEGTLVFGNQGATIYWDAAAWTGQPVAVPISAASNSGGMDTIGFNDDGYLLVLNTLRSTRSLDILKPVFDAPLIVTVRPSHKILRLRVGTRANIATVKTSVNGDSLDPSIRYIFRGNLPAGLRFRKNKAVLSGTPNRAVKFTLRVAATYQSNGVKRQSPFAKVKIVVRPR